MNRLPVVWAVLVMLLAACSIRDPAAPPAPAEPPPTATGPAAEDSSAVRTAADDRQDAERRLRAAEEELAAARRNVELARDAEAQARAEARQAGLRRITGIVAATSLLVLFASIALIVFLPSGLKKWGILGSVSGLAVLATCTFIDLSMRYLALLGGLLICAAVGWAVWYIRRLVVTARAAAAHGDRLEQAMRTQLMTDTEDVDQVLEAVKALSIEDQKRAGVLGVVAAVRGKAKPPKAPRAELVSA